MIRYLLLLAVILGACTMQKSPSEHSERPNILILYLDDLGLGDVGAYGATAIPTPNIDRLAHEGLQFLNGYATSATCTPSRYGLLTGEYPWKNKHAQILEGDAPLIIHPKQATLPRKLQQAGYATAVIGKWHLGLGDGKVDWNAEVSPGPNALGFDHAYIMAATNDRVPTVYLENGKVQGLDPSDPIKVSYQQNFEGEPTALSHPELLTLQWHHGHNQSIVNGVPRIGYMKGGQQARWNDEEMSDHFLEKAKAFLNQQQEQPFFLYYAMHQPHVPRMAHPRFQGATSLGARGDVIVEADDAIGQLMAHLDSLGQLENTLIVLTSDNGPVLNDGYMDQSELLNGDHAPTAGRRGGKYSLFDGGAHVPFITYWKGQILAGKSMALVSQLDLFNSINALLALPQEKELDSQNLLPVLLGKQANGREKFIVEASQNLALIAGDWAMIPPYAGAPLYRDADIELGKDPHFQLYHLEDDPGQQHSLADSQPLKLAEMQKMFLQEIKATIVEDRFLNLEDEIP
ncbi:sulfatase-like hydrolase/transferase [Persicobacter diffluens]|uniref:Arylsulfatase n=1 Tax=Persicobacter diffluens TaxID=981 RepID=A0AAN5AQ13_9BACT|nr:arylsulfatase [Persicobacter diffluens]